MVVNKRMKNIVIYLLLFVSIISAIPLEAFAHDAYFLQVLVDKTNQKYVTNVLFDKDPRYESLHMESQLGDFRDTSGNRTKYKQYETSWAEDVKNKHFVDNARMFTFSPYVRNKDDKFFTLQRQHSGRADLDRALEISDELVSNLNQILYTINDLEAYETTEDLIKASEVIINTTRGGSKTHNGWTISKSTKKLHGNTIEFITVSKGGEKYEFKSSMPRGYASKKFEDGRISPLYEDIWASGARNYKSDNITINMLTIQANYTWDIKGHSADDVGQYAKPNTLVKKIGEFFASMAIEIRNALGLYSIDEMVYNTGARDSRIFTNGMMSKQWWSKTISFHLVFQAMAWMFLIVGIVKMLFQQNLATLSASNRMSLMQGIKDLIITGFLLVTVMLLIMLASTFNAKMVSVFHTTIPQFNSLGNSSDVESLGGAIMSLYYVGISIYLNFVYIVRSIMLAVLIATAPFFIVTLAFQTREKQLFNSWLKELIAYMFIQSIHAFVISFIATAQMGARGIEVAISALSLIVVTNFFKNMIVGQSGGLMGEVAGKVTGGASAVAGVGMAIGSKNMKDREKAKSHESGGQSKYNSSSNIGKGSKDGGLPSEETSYSNMSNSHLKKKGGGVSSGGVAGADAGPKDKYEEMSSMPFKDAGMPGDIPEGESRGKAFAKGAGKAVGGAAMVAGGAAMTMASIATGGSGYTGAAMMGKGATGVAQGAVAGGRGAVGAAQRQINSYTQSKNEGGNILGQQRRSDGDYEIHRDKSMMEKDGFVDAHKTSDDLHNITYNSNSLNTTNRANLENIEKLSKSGNNDYLQQRGIENIVRHENGNYEVTYNKDGLNNLGYKDIYTTNSRVVEVKDNKNENIGSKLTYNPENVKARSVEDINQNRNK